MQNRNKHSITTDHYRQSTTLHLPWGVLQSFESDTVPLTMFQNKHSLKFTCTTHITVCSKKSLGKTYKDFKNNAFDSFHKLTSTRKVGTPKGRPTWWTPLPPSRQCVHIHLCVPYMEAANGCTSLVEQQWAPTNHKHPLTVRLENSYLQNVSRILVLLRWHDFETRPVTANVMTYASHTTAIVTGMAIMKLSPKFCGGNTQKISSRCSIASRCTLCVKVS